MSDSNHFSADMTVSDAMTKHPRAAEVFAAFHLGGCAHCHINAYETIEQVCDAYRDRDFEPSVVAALGGQ